MQDQKLEKAMTKASDIHKTSPYKGGYSLDFPNYRYINGL
jgi:hypothetical protein